MNVMIDAVKCKTRFKSNGKKDVTENSNSLQSDTCQDQVSTWYSHCLQTLFLVEVDK